MLKFELRPGMTGPAHPSRIISLGRSSTASACAWRSWRGCLPRWRRYSACCSFCSTKIPAAVSLARPAFLYALSVIGLLVCYELAIRTGSALAGTGNGAWRARCVPNAFVRRASEHPDPHFRARDQPVCTCCKARRDFCTRLHRAFHAAARFPGCLGLPGWSPRLNTWLFRMPTWAPAGPPRPARTVRGAAFLLAKAQRSHWRGLPPASSRTS